jgi:endonuclease/exonuclease/phosphatase family metal-dependent hydrolase
MVSLSGFFKIILTRVYPARVCLIVWLLVLMGCSVRPATVEPRTQFLSSAKTGYTDTAERQVFTGTLKLLTLNVAHGRKDGFNQLFQSEQRIRSNLAHVAALLKQTGADIVALQEADGPSRWSGNFDHVALLAQKADYTSHSRAGHAQGWLFDYGTALLARRDFTEMLTHTFPPSPPTLSKGFLLGQIAWQPNEDGEPPVLVDVISVHLDFSRSSVRQQQIAEMTGILANRKSPIIILGDFNSDWFNDESVVNDLAQRCGLQAYRPLADDLVTFRKSERRLDWILISDELEFIHYTVLPDIVSDHYAVVAEVVIRDTKNLKREKTDNYIACRI